MPRDEGRPSLPPHPTLDRYYADSDRAREFLDSMFEATAPHYGRLDGLVSVRIRPVLPPERPARAGLEPDGLLDVATGTGLVGAGARAPWSAPRVA